MSLLLRVLLGLILLETPSVLAQNLYVFSVIETSSRNRPDRAQDATILHRQIDKIALQGNYKQHWYDFGERDAFSSQTLRQTLEQFKPESEEQDVIWFHFAGRGYSDGPKAWPTLQLHGGDVPLREVLSVLRTKPVRTLLVTVDCGNRPRQPAQTTTGDTMMSVNKPLRLSSISPSSATPSQNSPPNLDRPDGYRQLFRQSRVRQIIIMAAAKQGETAYSHPKRGSVWLSALTTAIEEKSSQQNEPGSLWKQVQEEVVKITQHKTRNRQTPLYHRETTTCCETDLSH